MKYTYSAVFTPTEDGTEFYASVPDLPGCITTAATLEDAIDEITDAASSWLVAAEDAKRPIPAATPQSLLDHASGATFSLIKINTIAYRAIIDHRAVRKNVSLPAWMANLADQQGINCSQVLQDELKARFASL